MHSKQGRRLAIHALSVCVDYGDCLAWSLPHNIRHFDSFTVVTTGQDTETRELCQRYGAAVVLTERLHFNGSRFDKGSAINDGLEALQRDRGGGWFCIVDADMILPWNLRAVLEAQPIDPSRIHGIERGVRSDEPISGFFQLFHASTRRRYPEGLIDAGYSDTRFRDLWPAERQTTIQNLKAQHLCRHGVNWSGRVTARVEAPKQVVTPDTPVAIAKNLLCGPGRLGLPEDWRLWPNVQEAYRQAMVEAVTTMPPYPAGKYAGRGIVILGGGKYFASAYVTLRMIRHLGCNWPVEVWHLGKEEMAGWQEKLLAGLGARCVDALATRRPLRVLKGWEMKVLAVLHSRFERVLYLDADSYPCRHPGFLFEDSGFHKHGAMFFPDAPKMKLLPRTWEIMGIPFRDEPTIESGQFLIDKKKCWRGLALTHWMNQHSDYYYHIGPRISAQVGEHFGRGIHGDKDTFHLAWRYLGIEYAMPQKEYAWISPAVVQIAPDGKPVFIHRARRKFHLGDSEFGTSRQMGPEYEPKLPMEDVAHGFLAELQGKAKRENVGK